MWCPEGYYSWGEVLTELHRTSAQILSLVCLNSDSITQTGEKQIPSKSVEHYLTLAGHADKYSEARLIVAITTVYLMVKFLEAYPPVLASLDGNRISPDWPLFCHKDQFENCYFDWPLTSSAQFSAFFEYAKINNFDRDSLLDRFSFIDGNSGLIQPKNGAAHYLENGLGFEHRDARQILEIANKLKGHVVCWPNFPDEKNYRSFLTCIEVNETFSLSLDIAFGKHLEQKPPEKADRKLGRPRLRDELAQCYFDIYPKGHEIDGLAWKDAARAVGDRLGRKVDTTTLTRGIRELRKRDGQNYQK